MGYWGIEKHFWMALNTFLFVLKTYTICIVASNTKVFGINF